MNKFFCLLLFHLFSFHCISQLYIEPVVGYSHDARNEFNHVNTTLQFAWQKKNDLDLLIKLEKGWVPASYSQDSSFTLDPTMPLYARTNKRVKPDLWTLAGGVRLKLAGVQTNNIFSALLFVGVSYQKFSVSYPDGKANYVILNPDITRDRFGASVSGGFEFMRLLKKGRLFSQAIFTTPPMGRNAKFPSSFGLMIPISVNVGYSIPLTKIHHEKKGF